MHIAHLHQNPPHFKYLKWGPIALQPSTPVGFTDLNDVLDGVEPSALAKSSRSIETYKNIQTGPINEDFPVLRSYKSEEDILNSYYIYIHPYISLLPAPTKPQHDDQPEMIQPRTQDAIVFERSIFPHWPSSSLSLAISAILALIPLPQDPAPLSDASISLRRSCAQFYAGAALKEAEEEVDELSPGASALCMDSTQEKFHPDVPPPLHPVLAFTILSIFEDCQQGNLSQMRNRANRAITTAMDISLHNLGTVASEAQRRAWWSVVCVHFLSSILQLTRPIITMSDPIITTPFPIFNVGFEPWSLLLKAENAAISVHSLVQDCHLEDENVVLSGDTKERIQQLDSDLVSIIALSDRSPRQGECSKTAETFSSQNMWMIARVIAHSARIKLHRFRAFLDIPIFLDKYCGLSAIYQKNTYPPLPQLRGPKNFDSVFPFTVPESSLICLKSSLVVARAFKNIYSPNPCYTDEPRQPGTCQAITQVHPRSLPFFACAAMQSSYVLLMLHHRVQAALKSERLSTCHFFLNRPENEIEHQDTERLTDEMQFGVESMLFSLKSDLVFEGVGKMSREVEAAYQSTFLL
ncbi:hypothetical protein N7494_005308 [Penicillium frequentans]|uniref:Transcription factor domain-containing protein n=1 Tax=Penicillium frequentans TaxID=3151616 RepID=A0AAD6CXQ5_9EURO|nr:hypothetical protein N7494_005308 [Penicillium glabrum]